MNASSLCSFFFLGSSDFFNFMGYPLCQRKWKEKLMSRNNKEKIAYVKHGNKHYYEKRGIGAGWETDTNNRNWHL